MAAPLAVTFPFLRDHNGGGGNEDDKDEDNGHNDGDDDDGDNKRDNKGNDKVHPRLPAATGKTRTAWSSPGSTRLAVATVT